MNQEKPNILLLHADQHRADTIGCYGNPEVNTPHIDKLAQDGTRYDQSFCCFPICTPSRYSLLSGRYVHEHCGWSNFSTLNPSLATFPQLLRANGYRTTAIGKMHFTPTYLDVGFDRMLLAEQAGEGRWDDDYHRALRAAGFVDAVDLIDQTREFSQYKHDDLQLEMVSCRSNLPEELHSSTWIGNQCLQEIEQWDPAGGNLLMAGFIKPHHPQDPPEPWDGMYNANAMTLLAGTTEHFFDRDIDYHDNPRGSARENSDEQLRYFLAMYYANISQVDHQIGRIIKRLKEQNVYDNTLIIYTSDHGEYAGFHRMILKCGYPYDPIMRVPLIIKYPHDIAQQRVDTRLVNNIDIMPSILDCAGLITPDELPGKALKKDGVGHTNIFAEYGCEESNTGHTVMARNKTHKLIECNNGKESLLFDLQEDPHETKNLYRDPTYAAVKTSLQDAITKWRGEEWKQDIYLNHQAPIAPYANPPVNIESHRAELKAWNHQQMKELFNRED